MSYELLSKMAKEQKVKAETLIALARSNDPFYCGSPADMEKAQWFAEVWKNQGYSKGVHLRRIHYNLLSKGNILTHKGRPYYNTKKSWDDLIIAAKYARYLNLIPPDAFVDKRAPDPHIHTSYPVDYLTTSDPAWQFVMPDWEYPYISTEYSMGTPIPFVYGYEYKPSAQPYHIEIWVEKSTVDDVLIPICRRYGVNYVTGVGELSITSIETLAHRIAESGKPTRIFYISDFDPSGIGMPISIARKIEFLIDNKEVKLDPIVLTFEQVKKYKLIRTPIKDSNKAKTRFEKRFGAGAVELDSLEANHPGVLAEIVKEAILPYRDIELEGTLEQQEREITEELQEEIDEAVLPYMITLETLKDDINACMARQTGHFESFNREMLAIKERAELLHGAIKEAASIYYELPDREEAETIGDITDFMFDSSRHYIEQIAFYKRQAGK